MSLQLELTDESTTELVELVAARAAELVLEQLDAHRAPESEFLSVEEAAGFLRCDRQRIYDLCSSGRLERYRDGSRVLVRRADLVAHVLPTNGRARTGRALAR